MTDDLQRDGARLEFTCAVPVTAASVTVRTLTDLHPAYRTLATGPDGQRAVYGSTTETHRFELPAGPATSPAADPADVEDPATQADDHLGRSAALQLGGVLGALLLAGLTAALVARRRRSQAHPTTATTNPEETTRVPTPASS
ncbi:hypothetical protein [Nocardioides sp. TF02-7]|uniref:hypothetical protein n=1 Tax=Nocardioides sp. TF02-7 TaxID=2917724 RepID=UPI001F056AF0|nr:hypothetical protein [Nocardioides sp. TF02-7]UMG91148.1 hypothetical protein MF408_13170 [Nocardioides sp. TF02-7]